jgi:hypothetical protein
MVTYLIIRRTRSGAEPYVCYTGHIRNHHTYSSIRRAVKACTVLNNMYAGRFSYVVEKISIKEAKKLGYSIDYIVRVS